MRYVLMSLIRAYQRLLSPLTGKNCRYEPTCSNYAHEALREHGAFRGTWMAMRRLGRCHPRSAGGYDPLPARNAPDAIDPGRDTVDLNAGVVAGSEPRAGRE